MKKEKVTLVFDRKNRLQDENGMGTVEIFVYLARRARKWQVQAIRLRRILSSFRCADTRQPL